MEHNNKVFQLLKVLNKWINQINSKIAADYTSEYINAIYAGNTN